MFERIPEPSIMLDANQCASYNQEIINDPSCIDLFLDRYDKFIGIEQGNLIDLGSGSCNFVISLCSKYPKLHVFCYEVSQEMINIAVKNIESANVHNQITIVQDDFMLATGRYDGLIASRVLHHVNDHTKFWQKVYSLSNNILVCDLERPDSLEFVEKVCESESIDFKNSLLAAYNCNEVANQINDYPFMIIKDLKPGEYCVVTKK